jgi:hypothetical protein
MPHRANDGTATFVQTESTPEFFNARSLRARQLGVERWRKPFSLARASGSKRVTVSLSIAPPGEAEASVEPSDAVFRHWKFSASSAVMRSSLPPKRKARNSPAAIRLRM